MSKKFRYAARHYIPHVESARTAARDHAPLLTVLAERPDSRTLLGFLIEFAAIGVRVLRPTEDTLANAARTCIDAGLNGLGVELARLGHEAAQRRLVLLDDLIQLASAWREQFDAALDIAALVRRPAPAAAQRHAALRELAAIDELPFDSLAIELELGEFARGFGPRLIRAGERAIGEAIFAGTRYVQLRVDHAALGADDILAELDGLLSVVPELGPAMATAGAAALRTHVDLLELCIARGRVLDGAPAPRRSPRLRQR